MQWVKRYGYIVAVVAIIIMAVYCCINAKSWNPNLVSMVSGLWSAVATFVVGIIAYWQSKRYKELSDKLDDRQNAPEFYVPTPASRSDLEKMMKGTFNLLVAKGEHENGLATKQYFRFASLDKPILWLVPTKINVDGEEEILCVDEDEGIDVYNSHELFDIDLKNCCPRSDGNHQVKLYLKYENIYGVSYMKVYSCTVTVKSNKIVNKTWGTLSKAERISANG